MKTGGKRRLYIPGPVRMISHLFLSILLADHLNKHKQEKKKKKFAHLICGGNVCDTLLWFWAVGIPKRPELSARTAKGGSEQSCRVRCEFGVHSRPRIGRWITHFVCVFIAFVFGPRSFVKYRSRSKGLWLEHVMIVFFLSLFIYIFFLLIILCERGGCPWIHETI